MSFIAPLSRYNHLPARKSYGSLALRRTEAKITICPPEKAIAHWPCAEQKMIAEGVWSPV